MKKFQEILEHALMCFVAIIAGIMVSKYCIFVLTVEGSSMEPAYEEGDIRFALVQGNPVRGDVVVVDNVKPNEHLIKRVIGIPGDTIQVVGSKVYLNGSVLVEDYIPYDEYPSGIAEDEIHLDINEYFVMGDNRPVSYDSRYFGCVSRADIRGIVIGGKIG